MPLNPATLLTAVPNVSEGADERKVAQIAAAFDSTDGARLLAQPHSDADHGRSVFTLAGEPGRLSDALVAGTRAACEQISLSSHGGMHPHVGVVDVVPVVFLDEARRGAAMAEALVTADLLGEELGLSVFLYGILSGGRSRAQLRKGGLAGLTARVEAGEIESDFGPSIPDPAKGATLVAARPPLVAFNLELGPPATIEDAKRIAANIREGGSGGLPGVRAIGLELPHRGGVAQVSMNIEDHTRVSLAEVVAAVSADARVSEAELVGLAPAAAFDGFPDQLHCRNRATLEDALGF
ncbi:MAG: glutamate formiminotransferase [Actinobacteria bacterium]|uniref:glutamate formimidoyltransferase n=1 Tax=freshwater metagenome TaxID=449393 RepID=A0A6J5Z2C9_9ZZZZ|nr:glutamate formiminotransferase [Actinomycetota bacterium]